MGKMRPFVLNEDHFSSLVLMRTKSSIEDLYARTVSLAAHHNPLEHTSGAAPDPLGELHVLGHDGDPLGMDGAEHSVLKEGGEVGLRRLLKS